ncbi:hypothetical protein CRE_11231 [Caenorhabditis remanei]|uniref:7TM GPCR serpentine receptor class x (Srx) domain-containing protein n=1 Tax=Caenorhabditis remanei TaxID=31234 RepID=E3MQ37_CAERE|nr:hypothetical protein CRE_11231 [Caenorhabditis remanei]
MLTGNQAVYNGFHSLICLIYVSPMIVFDITFLKDNSHHVGFLLMLCYDVSIQILALITVNRFCAVFLPMMYSKLFNTLPILLQRSINRLQPHGSQNLLGLFSEYMPKLMTICTFNVVVDTITIWKVRRIQSARGRTTFQKKKIDFLKQSFGQALYLFICIPAYHIVPLFKSSEIALFMIGIFFGATIHMFDGVLTLIFNMEIRESLIKKYKASGNNSVIQIGVVSPKILL